MTAPGLFSWQRAIMAAALPRDLCMTGLRLGLDSAQTSGREVVINADDVARDVGCSPRTVWRRVAHLLEAGWLEQTAKPTYTGSAVGSAARGRRARYQLTIPGESCATDPREKAGDPSESCATPTCGQSHDPSESPATTSPDMARDSPSRVPNRAQSCDTATADDGTLSASDGLSSSSSSDDDDEVAVEILAGRLRRHTALATLRTDKLKPAQAAEVTDLISLHGDQALVDRALRTLRRDDPPQTIQAFLPGWRVMPRPGAGHLAAVPDPPCPLGGHTGTVRRCVQCASEAIAVDREANR